MKIKKLLLWSSLLLLGVFFFYIWYGFLYPDIYYVSNFSISGKLIYLWMPRILIPSVYLIIIIIVLIKNRKTARNITIMIIVFILLAVLVYPILDINYYLKSKLRNRIITEQFHPYLQLNPPSINQLDTVPVNKSFKIFCLGGSTTEFKDSKGMGWPEKLEKELRGIYNSDSIYVFNFGMQWYTTLHTLINYEANLRHYKPDVIILMHNINDFQENTDFSYLSKGRFREDYGHFMGPSANIFKYYGFFGNSWTRIKQVWHHKQRITFEQDSFPGLEPFTRNINTLIDLALMDNTKVVLLTQPNIYSENMDDQIKKICILINMGAVGKDKKWGFKTAYIGMNLYNEKIKAISENRMTYFIDLEKYVPKSLLYFTDEVHYTDTTFNIISKTLAEEIVKLKVITDKNK